ncbi:MAG: ClpP family protease [Christensenellales bacterium]
MSQEQGTTSYEQEGIQKITELGIPPKSNPIHCISVIGQIEGHILLPPQNKTTKYEHLIPMIVGVELDPSIAGLLIILNTVGGDVEAGLALAEMISSMTKPTVSLVLGGGHSIGVPLAVSAKYTFIASTATMTVHPIRMNGQIISTQQSYEYFDKMQKRIVDFVVNHCDITKEKLDELMLRTDIMASDIGTVLIGKETVDWGIIKEVGGLDRALCKLKEMCGIS